MRRRFRIRPTSRLASLLVGWLLVPQLRRAMWRNHAALKARLEPRAFPSEGASRVSG